MPVSLPIAPLTLSADRASPPMHGGTRALSPYTWRDQRLSPYAWRLAGPELSASRRAWCAASAAAPALEVLAEDILPAAPRIITRIIA